MAEAEAGREPRPGAVRPLAVGGDADRRSWSTAGSIDRQTRDETQNQFKAAEAGRKEAAARVASAEAAVKKAEADRDKAAADVAAAKARLEVAKAEVGRVDALRGYTKIKAPFDGVVTRRAVNTGRLRDRRRQDARCSAWRGSTRCGWWCKCRRRTPGWWPSARRCGSRCRRRGAGPMTGKVARTSWSLEPGSRTLRTEIDLPNEKGVVRPGMYVYARLTAELPAAWAVPAAAVGKVNDEPVIYLVENGKAVRVPVQLLRGDGQFTQVRRYKKPGASDWTDVTGTEAIATPATALADGQPVP